MLNWRGHAAQPAARLLHLRNQAGTLFITALPGGLDRYFAELNAAVEQKDNQAVAAVNEKYGVTFFSG